MENRLFVADSFLCFYSYLSTNLLAGRGTCPIGPSFGPYLRFFIYICDFKNLFAIRQIYLLFFEFICD